MNDYTIITNSTADLTRDMADTLGVVVIPWEFVIDGESYRDYPDEREMSHKEFYAMMRKGKMPTTTQVTPAQFVDIFEPILRQGKDILYLCFSSALSSTYERSQMAVEDLREKYPQRTIYSVDTRCASLGEGFLAELCVEKKQAGASLEEVKSWAEENRNHIAHWITVDDLNHLKRGGRISAASALMGSMLGIKPIIHVDEAGALIPVDKIRGRKASLDYIADHIIETVTDPAHIRIVHGDALEDAQYVEQRIRSKLKVEDVVINYVGPIIGAHTGPGMVAAVGFCSKK